MEHGTGKTDKVVKKLCEYVNKNSKTTETSKIILQLQHMLLKMTIKLKLKI